MVAFAVQAHANAAGDAAAAPGPLLGGGAGDFFHLQLIDFAALAIAIYSRQAGIDHIAYAWHRERRFRHISGQNNAPFATGFEDAILFRYREAREQRQNFRVGNRVFAQRFCGLADFPFAR